MGNTTLFYLELVDGVGLAPSHIVDPKSGLEVPNERAGEPDALTTIGIQVPVPTMVGDDLIDVTRRVEIAPGEKIDPEIRSRIIPDTRVVETDHPAVVNLLVDSGQYRQIDKPKALEPRRPKPATTNPEG